MTILPSHPFTLAATRMKMQHLRDDLIAIRGWFGCVHLLVTPDELVLIDSGFLGDFQRIQNAVATLGRKPGDLKAVLLTHGHLDHTLNAARLQEWCGARIYGPVGDERHIQGRYPYRGSARFCSGLESLGRCVLRFRPPAVDHWMRGGDELPYWGGLEVIALPGHTDGHVGFFSRSKRVLLAGDLFADFFRIALPPFFFNTDSSRIPSSIRTAANLGAERIIPNHYFRNTPEDTIRFQSFARRHHQAH